MRCENCGWENPDENEKCEKCNVPLIPFQDNNDITSFENNPDEYNLIRTGRGCSDCGYPLRQKDAACPNCGQSFFADNEDSEKKEMISDTLQNKFDNSDTIISSAGSQPFNKSGKKRKKLVGFLVTYSRSPNGAFFPLYEGKNRIGRAATSTILIKDDPRISDNHLSILYRSVDGKFKFKDEQSSNGTFVNKELMDGGELNDHDKIMIGDTKFLFIEINQNSLD